MTIAAVHHLNCATMCPLAGRWFGAGDAGLGRGHLVAHCLVIETARDGLVVVDTGFGTRDVEGKTPIARLFKWTAGPTLEPHEPVIAQLARLGYAAADVRHVVLTHLDIDHAGGISDFPAAKVHLHAREHAAATTRPTRLERERYLPAQWQHGPQWELYSEDGDTWRGLPAITKLRGLDADIGLLPLHGHTRGHSAVLVRTGEGWLVHAGDAYFHRHAMSGQRIPHGFAVFERMVEIDGAARRASAAALRSLHDRYPDLSIFCAHDPEELARQQAV